MDWKTKSRRRTITSTIYASGFVAVIVILLFMLTHSLEDNNSYGSLLSTLLAIGTAFTGIVIFLRRTEPPLETEQEAAALVLELLGQWEPEVKHRRQRFGDSRTIPLSWVSAGHDVGDDPAAVVGSGSPLGTVRLKLEGRLADNPDRAASQLAEQFDRLPSKRLVMLGEPGAGKTFLGITLTVGLLHRRVAGSRVPVFLSLSSWDPVSDSLDEWIVRNLASAHYGGRERTPRALLTARLILPVLDGLDELPEHLRRRAISRINDTLDGDRPLVLTCRSAEYKDVLAGGAPVLLRAPVVEVRPVSIADIVAHLEGHASWTGVVEHVEENPDGPLATALATPLMLSLFVAAYRDREPTDLLGDGFTSRYAVEDHLVDLLLDAVYPADPVHDGKRCWTSQQARAWLTYLAQYLHRHEERDLAWWQLARRTLSPWIAPVLGLAVGFITFWLASVLSQRDSLIFYESDPVSAVLNSPAFLGTIFGVIVTSLWLVGDRRIRGRTLLTNDRGNGGFGRGMATGSLLVLVPGIPLLMGSSLESTGYEHVVQKFALAGALIALSVVAGLAVALHELLMARSIRIGQASPEEFLRQDRRSALSAAAATGVVVGATSGLATTIAAAVAGHIGERVALALNMPTVASVNMPPLATHVPWLWPESMPTLITASILLVVLFALAVLTTRAWTRFLVARVSLAVSGDLPWRLMKFLADARDRGVLRGAGGSYQFWHVRLQERLVAAAAPRKPTKGRRRRWLFMAAALTMAALPPIVVSIGSAEPADCRRTGWSGVDGRISRSVISDDSACFALLNRDEWHELEIGAADVATLDRIKAVDPEAYVGSTVIYVIGELDQVRLSRWHGILQGLAAAQDVSDIPFGIEFVHAEFQDNSGPGANVLTALYLESLTAGDNGAVNIDIAESHVSMSEYEKDIIAGLSSADFHKLTRDFTDRMIDNWLKSPRQFGSGSGPDASAEDLTDESCAKPTMYPAWTFDLRADALTKEKIDRIADCGASEVLVNESQAEELRAQQPTRQEVGFIQVEDKSATIATDCSGVLGEQADADSLAACVGALAVATNFRVTFVAALAEN